MLLTLFRHHISTSQPVLFINIAFQLVHQTVAGGAAGASLGLSNDTVSGAFHRRVVFASGSARSYTCTCLAGYLRPANRSQSGYRSTRTRSAKHRLPTRVAITTTTHIPRRSISTILRAQTILYEEFGIPARSRARQRIAVHELVYVLSYKRSSTYRCTRALYRHTTALCRRTRALYRRTLSSCNSSLSSYKSSLSPYKSSLSSYKSSLSSYKSSLSSYSIVVQQLSIVVQELSIAIQELSVVIQ